LPHPTGGGGGGGGGGGVAGGVFGGVDGGVAGGLPGGGFAEAVAVPLGDPDDDSPGRGSALEPPHATRPSTTARVDAEKRKEEESMNVSVRRARARTRAA
jgi:hypothetical protein